MDKTININLGGILFQIDEEAYLILRDYLQAINHRFGNVQGGNETIEDIETRISEIFQSQKGLAGVITRDNVEKMISIIGKPEEFDVDEPQLEPHVNAYRKKRMYRNLDDKILGGVCSGIGYYLNTDPVIFRILFVLFTAFFGAGLFIYLGLWIALPVARTDSQKRDLYSNSGSQYDTNQRFNSTSAIGNAFNEIFRAIGRVFYIIFRIFMIIFGISLVLFGFLSMLSFVVIFVFKFPGIHSFDSSSVNLIHIPSLLNYIVNPSIVPWIIILASIAFILPMLALIYWGVKMIFWFKAKDGIVSLAALVVWVLSVATLTIIGLNEGISFATMSHVSKEAVLSPIHDTLYIHSDRRIADLKYEKEISLPHNEYSVYINDENKELYLRPFLHIDRSDDKIIKVEIIKSSAGRNEMDANNKADALKYNYSLRNDSLGMDEYFTLPTDRKWAADEIDVNLKIPSGTIVKFDKDSKIPVHSMTHYVHDNDEEWYYSNWDPGTGYWIMTDDGLQSFTKNTFTKN